MPYMNSIRHIRVTWKRHVGYMYMASISCIQVFNVAYMSDNLEMYV